jgi:hypothetical protein
MTTRPRSIGPCSIGPNGSWVPYTMNPFVIVRDSARIKYKLMGFMVYF